MCQRSLIDGRSQVNHFPGSFQIGRKDKLWYNLTQKAAKHGESVFHEFHPKTYLLPQDLKELRQSWIDTITTDEWKMILKPPASARGNGITVINRWSQIPKFARISRNKRNSSKPVRGRFSCFSRFASHT